MSENMYNNPRRRSKNYRMQQLLKRLAILILAVIVISCTTIILVSENILTKRAEEKEKAYAAQLQAAEEAERQAELERKQAEEAAAKAEAEKNMLISEKVDIPEELTGLDRANYILQLYAEEHGYSMDSYPDYAIEAFSNNAELESYVCRYPEMVGTGTPGPLTEYQDVTFNSLSEMPLLIQWDDRWGYLEYGASTIGFAGCGPTSLSMIALYMNHDINSTPDVIAQYAVEKGYRINGAGTAWGLFDEGAKDFGLNGSVFALDETRIASELQQGHPFIFNMAPGDFTVHGHYIVVTGYEDGYITVNDPNSHTRSAKKWKFTDIQDQITNLWVFRPNE